MYLTLSINLNVSIHRASLFQKLYFHIGNQGDRTRPIEFSYFPREKAVSKITYIYIRDEIERIGK